MTTCGDCRFAVPDPLGDGSWAHCHVHPPTVLERGQERPLVHREDPACSLIQLSLEAFRQAMRPREGVAR